MKALVSNMILIKNARLVNDGNNLISKDILIANGIIKSIGTNINAGDDLEIIDAKNNLLIPGGIDVHVHLRQPGFEHKETIKTGSMAAAKGGYTTIMPMPNLKPTPDNIEMIGEYLELINKNAVINVIPYTCITKGEEGTEIVDYENVKNTYGLRYFSDDGVGIQNAEVMETAFNKIKAIDGIISAHTEDMSYRKPKACVHDGAFARKNRLVGIPSETEYIQIERDLKLAKKTGVKYHICHMSTRQGVELLRKYKKMGVNATGEVTIHHLLLTENDIKDINDANYKMNPPLRSSEDKEALIEGLLDGTIDFLANDHAPHTETEKSLGMVNAPFGISTIENAIALFYTYFVKTGMITYERFVDFVSTKPANRFGFAKKGCIKEGYDADLVLLKEEDSIIDKSSFISKGKNTPFDNKRVAVVTEWTMCGGKLVYRR